MAPFLRSFATIPPGMRKRQFAEIVACDQDRDLAANLVDPPAQTDALSGIQPRFGLIQEEQTGWAHQRRRECQAAAHPLGEQVDETMRLVVHTRQATGALDVGAGTGGGRRQAEETIARPPRRKHRVFRQVADALSAPVVGRVGTGHGCLAADRRQNAQKRPEQCGLPRAVGPHHREHFAGRHVDGKPAQHPLSPAVPDIQVRQPEFGGSLFDGHDPGAYRIVAPRAEATSPTPSSAV